MAARSWALGDLGRGGLEETLLGTPTATPCTLSAWVSRGGVGVSPAVRQGEWGNGGGEVFLPLTPSPGLPALNVKTPLQNSEVSTVAVKRGHFPCSFK